MRSFAVTRFGVVESLTLGLKKRTEPLSFTQLYKLNWRGTPFGS
jgi:hypothetical protein